MKMRLMIPVLLVSLLWATAPMPSMAAGAPHPAMNHCLANSHALAYPAADLASSPPRLVGYAIPYSPADLDGHGHNCLASGPTRSEDGNDHESFVHYAILYAPADLHRDSSAAVRYAVPYPLADLDGDSRPATIRYTLSYPSADLGDDAAFFVR